MTFRITDHVDFDRSNRAVCPSCAKAGKTKKKNLALVPETDGAYKCHRGCTSEEIREALGQPASKQLPSSQAPTKRCTVTPQKVKEAHGRLLKHTKALAWLTARGISDEIINRHKLGLTRCKVGKRQADAITIFIPANADKTAYYQKKRVAPWDDKLNSLDDYQPWKQYGIPSMVYFTLKPEGAKTTWLCEGEWDALLLADNIQHVKNDVLPPIAVATFTTGSSAVPGPEELDRLPGQVVIWYDRNDTPTKQGKVAGRDGAIAVARRLGDQAHIAQVPMAEDCTINGWDVSNAITHGHKIAEFIRAAAVAVPAPSQTTEPDTGNPVLNNLRWNSDLVTNAPDYTEFLVPDLLTEDELFVLAAPPRAGKSLLAMDLSRAVATGSKFLGRPCTQGTVLYVKCEDSDTKIKEREQAQGWPQDIPVAWLDDFKLQDVEALDEAVEKLDARLVILDTLSRVKDSAISESSAEMSQLLEPLQKMANRCGCCVVVIHHTGKVNADTANQGEIFDTIRGSSAIRAVARGSMVLAKGENSYRLVCENGWGKHDLRIAFDADSLRWQLLGDWNPPKNESQQQRIISALKELGESSLEQIHVKTGIAKGSLYKQLSRLMASEIAGEKVQKLGTKRNYTYRLALLDTLRQIPLLSNSCPKGETESGQGIRAAIRQKDKKSIFSREQAILDNSNVTVENPNSVQLDRCLKEGNLSNINAENPDGQSIQPIGQLLDTPDICPIVSKINGQKPAPTNTKNLSSNVPVEKPKLNSGQNVHQRTFLDANGAPCDVGHVVEILRPGTLIGQHATVVSVADDFTTVEVNRDGWVNSRFYESDEIEVHAQ